MITVISGGTGSFKLLGGIQRALGDNFTIIGNVGDNIWLYGLYICPDIDTILYGLSNLLDRERGWGIRGDTFNFVKRLGDLGEENWFNVGDRDLATHILRTRLLSEGLTLSRITSILAERFGVGERIIPSTDHSLETMVQAEGREMHLQEFWVKRRGEPAVRGVRYRGIEEAEAAKGVTEAILGSERIIIAPGNPVSSIGPTISIREIADALRETKARKVAVSPVIGNSPISGPAGAMMNALGYDVSPLGVARFYSKFVDVLVIDESDRGTSEGIRAEGVKPEASQILMNTRDAEDELARVVLSV